PYYNGVMLKTNTVSNAVLAAANSHRLEIIVPFYMRAGVWLKHTIPFLINPMIGFLFRRELSRS
ncbi:MAG: hypothetical protein WAM27_09340, partial [Nitrososphaeraceae archaeon]